MVCQFRVQPRLTFQSLKIHARASGYGLVVALILPFASVWANELETESTEAAFVCKLGNEVLDVLESMQSLDDPLNRTVRAKMQQGFDLERIGRFALGRYWHEAGPEAQLSYLKVFSDYAKSVNLHRLWRHRASDFRVIGEVQSASGDVLVATSLLTIAEDAPDGSTQATTRSRIVWRVRDFGEGPRIVDVIYKGVSMAMSLRHEFVTVVRQEGIEALIARLTARIADLNRVEGQHSQRRDCVPCFLVARLKAIEFGNIH